MKSNDLILSLYLILSLVGISRSIFFNWSKIIHSFFHWDYIYLICVFIIVKYVQFWLRIYKHEWWKFLFLMSVWRIISRVYYKSCVVFFLKSIWNVLIVFLFLENINFVILLKNKRISFKLMIKSKLFCCFLPFFIWELIVIYFSFTLLVVFDWERNLSYFDLFGRLILIVSYFHVIITCCCSNPLGSSFIIDSTWRRSWVFMSVERELENIFILGGDFLLCLKFNFRRFCL